MTMEELIRAGFPERVSTWKLYDSIRRSLPKEVKSLVTWFRRLCVLGGRIPVPLVFIRPDRKHDSGIYVDGGWLIHKRVIPFFYLIIQVDEAVKTLQLFQDHWKLSRSEIGLNTAAHELRHILQLCHVIGEWRGERWLLAWVDRYCPDWKSELVQWVSKALPASVDHAQMTARKEDSRMEQNRRILWECDASVTEAAVVLARRMGKDPNFSARIIHG